MLEMIWKPTLYGFDTCKEFAEAFRLNRDDLILSNAYIYEPYFGCMENLNCYVIFQEKYGAGEPTDVMVDAILADAAKTSCKRVIAIGGGTVIDIAKVLAVSDGEGVDDLYDKAPDLEKKRELIIIPTTCGTGSEVTNISIMARTRIGTKLGLVSPAMYADYAVLIPQLLEGLPFKVFAASSIDALVHAVESALSPKATPYTKLFGYKAIEMIIRGYQTIAKKGAGEPLLSAQRLPAGLQLCGPGLWHRRLRRRPRHQLPPGRQVSCGPRREQLRHVYRGAQELHGAPPGRGDCGPQPVSGRPAGLYARRGL